jgi:hypothetical protein
VRATATERCGAPTRIVSMRTFFRQSATAIAVSLSILASSWVTAAPVSAWAHAGDGYATHDWVVDKALDILDHAGKRPDWFDRDLALPYTDDPDSVERVEDPSSGWDHVYYDNERHGGAVQRVSEHYTAALEALEVGDSTAATINVALLSHFLSDIGQPYHTSRAGLGQSSMHAAYESAVKSRTRTPEAAPGWSDATVPVSATSNVRKTAAGTASYSRARFADLHAAFSATGSVDNPTVNRITGEVLRRVASDLANVIWSLDQGTGRSPDLATLSAKLRWIGVRNADPAERVIADVRDAAGAGIGGALVAFTWPLADGTRKLYRTWTNRYGHAELTFPVGKLPMLRRQDIQIVATVNAERSTRDRWFIPSPKLADGRAGFKTVVNDPTPDVGQTIKVTSLARDTAGRPVPGLLVTWTWDLGSTSVRTSAVTNAYGRAYSYRKITSSITSGTVPVTARVQSYSQNRSSSTAFNRN